MQTRKKNDDFIEFVKTLKLNQKIVFSDEGNLVSRKALIGSNQDMLARKKPFGLWYSRGPVWVEFLTSDYKDLGDPEKDLPGDTWTTKRITSYTHIYKLSLRNKFMLRLNTFEEYADFTARYGTKNKKGIYWGRVAKDWDGIEVRWRERALKELPWFDGWDCSSGCIWDENAVRSVKLIAEWRPIFNRVY